MKAAIEIINFSFRYSNRESKVFNNLNLKIPQGKLSLLVGSSGCGKSTMALSLTGIIPSSIEGVMEGDILLKGESIRGKAPGELSTRIGIVFQDPESQFCTFTVEDEIAFGLENLNLSKEEMDKRIDEVLGLVNMKDYRYRQLNQLSGGEKQKIAICSILALGADCIVLDEPTANLDPKSSADIFSLLVYLRNNLSKTIVIIEHKLDDLVPQVDNIILLAEDGSIEYTGSPSELIGNLSYEKDNLPLWFPEIGVLSRKLNEKNKAPGFFITHDQAVSQLKKFTHLFVNKGVEQNGALALGEKLIEINNLTFDYDNSYRAINNISLDIYAGEFLAIAGSNGAGKSTLSKILLGLYKNFNGEVLVQKKPVGLYKKGDLVKKIGLVFQNPEHQFVSSRVYDELAYGLKLKGFNKYKIDERVNEYLDRFNLKAFRDYNPFQLSQGQKRRLSVASMLIGGQSILMLDEPTYGQDKKNTEGLMEYMKELNLSGVTIIIITHDMNLIANYCSRVVLLNKGEKIFDGEAGRLFQDKAVQHEGSIEVPPIPKLSLSLKEYDKGFPFFMSISDYVNSMKGGASYDGI